jgi:predicted dehydrogenase
LKAKSALIYFISPISPLSIIFLIAIKEGLNRVHKASIKKQLCCLAVFIIALASSKLSANGFSHNTCFPWRMACILNSACEIGDIKYINADFAFKSTKSLTSRVMNLKLGGGAILDIGLYPAFLAYVFLGMPKSIVAKSTFHETTHCDIQSSMIFDYSKAQALLYCGFTSRSDRKATISGTEGQIHIDYPWHHTQGFTLISNNKEQKFNLPTIGIGYSHEIIECHDCINKNKIESLLWSHQNSLELISILDKVRKQVGLKYPQE